MHMNEFSKINKNRSEKGFKHTIESWSLSDWGIATLGELGEAGNIVKKLNRLRDNIKANKEKDSDYNILIQKLGTEIADTFIYLDLFAQAAGFSLQDIVIDTFNKKSKELKFDNNEFYL